MQHPSKFRLACLAVAVSQALGAGISSAAAATITVDSLTDDGTGCTLRDAVASANQDPGSAGNGCVPGALASDEIVFSPALLDRSLSLTNGELVIKQVLRITGFADQPLVIDAGQNSRLLQIVAGAETTLTDLTLTGGSGTIVGGAVYAKSSLVLERCTVTGNTSISRGGGIYTTGPLTLIDSSVSHNTLTAGSTGKGGGIYENTQGEVILQNSTISGNSANLGGGIYSKAYFNGQGVKVYDSTIDNNYASLYGGGVYARYAGGIFFARSKLKQNTSGLLGGAVFVKGDTAIELDTSEVLENHAGYQSPTAQGGGAGLWIRNSSVTVRNSTISNNLGRQRSGGGIYQIDTGTLYVVNSTISGNSAGSGAGIGIRYNVTAHILFSTIINNTAASRGGILLETGTTATIENSLIAGNTTSEIHGYGGELISAGVNFIGHSGFSNATAITGTPITLGENDLTGTSDGTTPVALSTLVDSTLTDHTGSTPSHRLPPMSPAINTADSSDCGPGFAVEFDQIGTSRDVSCDIGSVEFVDETSCFVLPAGSQRTVVFCL